MHASRPTDTKTVSKPPSEAPAHLLQLDGLRGVAVLCVLVAHSPDMPGAGVIHLGWRVAQSLRSGYVGVDLFFVLSGFLITRLLLAERRRCGEIDIRSFYARRAVRILPIYLLAVVAVATTWPTSPGLASSLVLYWFNLYAPFHPQPYPLEHTWSLAVEEQFYLLWPAAVAVLPLRWIRRATLLVIPLCALGAAVLYASTLRPTLAGALIYSSLPTRMFSLSLGAYLAVREAEGTAVTASVGGRSMLLGAILLLLALASRAVHVLPAGGWYWSFGLLGYGLFAFGAVAGVAGTDGPAPLRAMLRWSPLRFVGRISYGLYLYHVPVLYYLGLSQAEVGDAGVRLRPMLAAYALVFAAATVSYLLIERPLLRRKARFAQLVGGRGLTPLAPAES